MTAGAAPQTVDPGQRELNPGAASRGTSAFRPDVEGLRALAIGAVLLYHAGIVAVPGGFVGVDVFFVISGFLITGQLVRELEATGRVSLLRFYARRARRLLPAAALVLVATAVMVVALGSVVDRRTFGGDIVAASGYVVNWRLAERSVDYLAEDVGVSPVQHFWSLSVEEQFYVIWPLLLIVVGLLARRFRWPARTVMAAGLAAIVVPSFIWSVVMSSADPSSAFFVTTTRLWELGIGGLVAVGVAVWPRVPKPVALALGWSGLAAIIAGALLLDESATWPGHLALVPVLGTAAVIVAGATRSAPAILGHRLLVWLGGLSYSLYLWHWPLLVAATWVWGDLGQKRGLLVVLLALIPAWLSYKLVEDPVRRIAQTRWTPRMTLSVGLNLTAVSVIAGLVLAIALPQENRTTTATTASGAAGLTLEDGRVAGLELQDSSDSIAPAPADAPDDVPRAYADDCVADPETTEPTICTYGDPAGNVRVVLAGDSKALQWADALDAVAKSESWQLDLATKSACGFADAIRTGFDDGPYEECQEYNENLLSELLRDPPDAVIVSQRHSTAFDADGDLTTAAMADGLGRTWETLEEHGIDVIALLDNPAPPETSEGEVYRCVAAHPAELSSCAFTRDEAIDRSGAIALRAAAEQSRDVDIVDMTDTLCEDTACPPVIGDVLVYRQGSHITNTYAMSTRVILADRIAPLLETSS
ncbi:acyltransferase family protein [Isoptericola rhizosphaerae]|uniref:acyltransferase family protein n=1 Tax=Isoptericola rhizosphaerae TaxID=3377837 RepID=UPI00383AFC18